MTKGSLVRVVISDLRNRNTQGNTGSISIHIVSSKGDTIDQILEFEGLTIVAGNLSDAFITIADSTAAKITTYGVNFRCSAVGLETVSFIALQFPQNINSKCFHCRGE